MTIRTRVDVDAGVCRRIKLPSSLDVDIMGHDMGRVLATRASVAQFLTRTIAALLPPPSPTRVMALQVDLVITFKTSSNAKRVTKEDVRQAEEQYARLIKTLKKAGLLAVGRRGESLGDLLVFVKCPEQLLNSLVRRERCVVVLLRSHDLTERDDQAFRLLVRPAYEPDFCRQRRQPPLSR